jgi:hypothetical protein
MAGMNRAIQLAAALDRRGVTVSVDLDRVRIHLGGYREYIVVQGHESRVKIHDIGRNWFWDYLGEAGQHSVDDYEGAADAIEKFLRDIPGLAGSHLLYRMNHIGWNCEQEEDEILERTRPCGKTSAGENLPKARRAAGA